MAKIGVRARAVDLLGRQQIAGIPTAVHELFKNAHDAYAERVEVDYFRKQRILVLRDDGYGMTRADVEGRWLTLGTESRIGANADKDVWTGPKNLPRRAIMGEKGIGRLAIAVIAPITLLMTRAARQNGERHDLVVGLVHWGIFEQPSLEIHQIDVPLQEFPDGQIPNKQDIAELVGLVRKNIEALKSQLAHDAYEQLIRDLSSVDLDPDRLDALLAKQANERSPEEKNLSLRGNECGTHFIMLPTAVELNDDIDGGVDDDATFVERNLLGFSNTMTDRQPPIVTAFRDHRLDGTSPDLIGRKEFFTKADLESLDQFIEGTVDEFGQFVGQVRVYGNDPINYVCNWPPAKGRPIKCGKFSVRFGYLMGKSAESLLPIEKHRELNERCNRIGGIYIYRDNIRILPYGNQDFDFLNIELNRAKAAKDAFFSFRRMAGYVALTHEDNSALNEKAGREGFRQNQAYRDFVAILKNLIDRLAKDFFRKSGDLSESFWEQKTIFEAEIEAAKKQKQKADEKRAELAQNLQAYFDRYEVDYFTSEVRRIEALARSQIEALDPTLSSPEYASELSHVREELYSAIRQLEADNRVSKPSALSIKGTLAKNWASYNRLSASVRDDLIVPCKEHVTGILNSAGKKIETVYRAEQASIALEQRSGEIIKHIVEIRNEAYNATEAFKRTLRDTVRSEFSGFKAQLVGDLEKFVRQANTDPDRIEELYVMFQDKIEELKLNQAAHFAAIRDQMKSLGEDLDSGFTADTRAYIWEQRAERLEEQLEFYQEYAQMGMGLGILQHELSHVAGDFQASISAIQPWAAGTPELRKVYDNLRTSFESLNSYLKVLDPLGRRLHRSTINVSGDKVYLYLMRLFGPRMKENDIELVPTNKFRTHSVTCKSSTIFAAFTNVVDNAIYWLIESGKHERREIKLDADETGFLISNNGPGIAAKDAEWIFNFGESGKKGGTGLGLPISKSALREENLDLTLHQFGAEKEPVFKIHTGSKGEV